MNEFKFNGKVWRKSEAEIDRDGNEGLVWNVVPITDVPVEVLLVEYEELVLELSENEMDLYKLKEAYLIAERDIIANTNFKELYGANNEKVRSNHVKNELADMVEKKASLQFRIDFIKQYIPLLREVVRCKQ